MTTLIRPTFWLFTALPLAGQMMSGPSSAWTYDAAERSLRAISGLPGAAQWGAALVTNVDGASVGPGCQKALLSRGDAWTLYPEASSGASLIAAEAATWSADGSTALLVAAKQGWVQFVDHGAAQPPMSIVPGELKALALAPSGTRAVVAIDGMLYDISRLRAAATLPSDADSLAIDDNGAVYNARRETGRLERIREGVRDEIGLLTEPLGIALDRSGRLLALQRREVVVMALGGAILSRVSLDAPADGWQPGCHEDIRLLRQRDQISLFLAGPEPRVFFIPAARSATPRAEDPQ